MAGQTYERPELPPEIKPVQLAPDGARAELTPSTRVLIINRGTEPYRDKYDGRNYTVPPGVAEVEYGVALHLRDRSVVPGSRNPITGKQDHLISILGIDRPDRCEPLSEEAAKKAAETHEALDREAMGDDRAAVVPTRSIRSRLAGVARLTAAGRGSALRAETGDGTQELDVKEVLAPVQGGDAMRQIAQDAAERSAGGEE